MLDKNLITSALSKPDETGNCFGSLEAAYKEAEIKERNEMVEKEAEDIRQLIAAGVLERDSQGRLKKKMDDRISWVEDASYVAPPHNYQVSSDLISRTIAKCDGHRYEVTLPGAVWTMNSVIEFTELTNRQLSKESRDSHWYVESRNVYRISVGDAIDIIRGRNASDVPKEVKDLLRIIIRRNMKKISF